MLCASIIIFQVLEFTKETNIFQNGNRTGFIIFNGAEGGNFSGEFINCLKNGQGRINYSENSDRVSYDGYWRNDKRDGQGTMIWRNNETYIGQWENDNMNGAGTFHYMNGNIYFGQFKNGLKDGHGVLTYTTKDEFERVTYQGKWMQGKKTGNGTMISKNSVYEGEWMNNLQSGKGISRFSDGSIYNGTWLNGEMSGFGIMTLKNNAKYVGQWKDGKQDGNGTQYDAKNVLFRRGLWVQGKYFGE